MESESKGVSIQMESSLPLCRFAALVRCTSLPPTRVPLCRSALVPLCRSALVLTPPPSHGIV